MGVSTARPHRLGLLLGLVSVAFLTGCGGSSPVAPPTDGPGSIQILVSASSGGVSISISGLPGGAPGGPIGGPQPWPAPYPEVPPQPWDPWGKPDYGYPPPSDWNQGYLPPDQGYPPPDYGTGQVAGVCPDTGMAPDGLGRCPDRWGQYPDAIGNYPPAPVEGTPVGGGAGLTDNRPDFGESGLLGM